MSIWCAAKIIKCRGNGLTAIAVRKKKKKKKNALTILANRDSTMYLDIYLESVSRKYVCVGDCWRKEVRMRICMCVCMRACQKISLREIISARAYTCGVCICVRERERENKHKYIYIYIKYTVEGRSPFALEEERKWTRFIQRIIRMRIVYFYDRSKKNS